MKQMSAFAAVTPHIILKVTFNSIPINNRLKYCIHDKSKESKCHCAEGLKMEWIGNFRIAIR